MNNPNNEKNQNLTPASFEKIIQLQERELVLRSQELELRKQNDINSHEFAKASLEANLKDREDNRKHYKSILIYRLILLGIIIIVVFAFLAYTLYLNKDQIAFEIIKAIIFILTGGGIGYSFGKSKASEDTK